jgi:hypothetical protein
MVGAGLSLMFRFQPTSLKPLMEDNTRYQGSLDAVSGQRW